MRVFPMTEIHERTIALYAAVGVSLVYIEIPWSLEPIMSR